MIRRQRATLALLGLAICPLDTDRFNAFAKIDFKTERDSLAGDREDVWAGAVEGVYDLTDDLEVAENILNQ